MLDAVTQLLNVASTHDAVYIFYVYCIAGKFGEFGELSVICQTNLVLTIDNLLADLLVRQTFFRQMFEKSQFAKLSRYIRYIATFLLSASYHAVNSYPCMRCTAKAKGVLVNKGARSYI